MDEGLEKCKEAVDKLRKALDRRATEKPIGKVIAKNVSDSVGRRMAEGLGYNCRCVMGATGTPQHSGRYPWKETVPLNLPPGVPSPGFVFANKDWIKRNMKYSVDWETDTLKCIVRNGEMTIYKEFAYVEFSGLIPEMIDTHEDLIISELAREYDNIMIRKVLNMDSTRFNRFVSMVNAAGGNFKYETSVGEEMMATIQIPASMLSHLHIDGDGSIGLLKKIIAPKIPAISQIQTFNDRVVQITFIDGSQTKCVCGKDEAFDLYEGIAFCLFKRFLGKEDGHKTFNNLMRYAMKKLDEQEKRQSIMLEAIEKERRRVEKIEKQKAKRKARKREEKIGIFVEALKRNRQALINEMPVYSVPEPSFKPDENPYINPGEHEPPTEPVKKIDDGSTLFFDPLSGKTFTSSREKILLAVEALNKRILENCWVSVNEWYEELGLDSSGNLGESMGWTLDHMVEIDFVSDISGDSREYLAIVYVKRPISLKEGKV